MKTPVSGFFMADTSYYYPEDRGIAESVRLGSSMAKSLGVVSPSVDPSAPPVAELAFP